MLRAEAGEHFYTFAERLIENALWTKTNKAGEHNGIVIKAHPHSCPEDLCTIYDLKCELRRLKKC
jgi:hypothetical protein